MADSRNAIKLAEIPQCVRFTGGSRLADHLGELEMLASGAQADGDITAGEFYRFQAISHRLQLHPSDTFLGFRNAVRRFATFEEFKGYIDQYVKSQRCRPECRPSEGRLMADGRGDICIAPPEPSLPPLPKRAKKEEPDISRYSLKDRPDWFDRPIPKPAPHRRPAPKKVPSLSDLATRRMASPLEKFNDEPPEVADPTRAFIRVSYDGKNFILEFHGCYVDSPESRKCVADWAYFIASVRNKTRNATVSREANAFGMVRVVVEAERGDRLVGWGSDPTWGGISLNRLHYYINSRGEVVFELDELADNHNINTMGHLNDLSNRRISPGALFDPDFWRANSIALEALGGYKPAERNGGADRSGTIQDNIAERFKK